MYRFITSLGAVEHEKNKRYEVLRNFKTGRVHPPKNRLLSIPLIINTHFGDPTTFNGKMNMQYGDKKKNARLTKIKPHLPKALARQKYRGRTRKKYRFLMEDR